MTYEWSKDLGLPPPDGSYSAFLTEGTSDSEAAAILLSSALQKGRDELRLSQYSRRPDAFVRAAKYTCSRLTDTAEAVREFVTNDPDASTSTVVAITLQTMLVVPLLVLPPLFRYPRRESSSRYYRKQTMNGVYGQIAEYAGELLHDHQPGFEKEQQKRSQALGQLSFLGLANRSEHGEFCALPTLYKEARQGWNIDCFNYQQSEPRGMYTRVRTQRTQTPSSSLPPPHVVTASGDEFGWRKRSGPWYLPEPFTTIHAMELELAGQDDAICGSVTAKNGLNKLARKTYRIANMHATPLP
jgi:hypothetical protein